MVQCSVTANRLSMQDEFDEVSPIVTYLHPHASWEEKKVLTIELREHIAALYRWYCRLDSEGLLDDEPKAQSVPSKFESGLVSIRKEPPRQNFTGSEMAW